MMRETSVVSRESLVVSRLVFIFTTHYLLLTTYAAWALPPFRSLFEAKYSYKVNCSLCHNMDDWELNAYGRGFLKNGLNSAALEVLEKIDIDKDGFLGGEEIKAGSNPGDPLSTPEKVGNWIKEIIALKPPVKVLKAVFPEAQSFEALERPLTLDEIKRLTQVAPGAKLDEFDKFVVAFVARETSGIAGAAVYVPIVEPTSRGVDVYVFLLAANPNGKILHLEPIHVHRKDFKNRAFLKQFQGLWPDKIENTMLPQSTPAKLVKRFHAQIAKYAAQVDAVLPP